MVLTLTVAVLPNLVMLCYSHAFTIDDTSPMNMLLDELLPALQLATQIDLSEQFVQNSLLPALRKLEGVEQILSEHRSAIESLIHKLSDDHHKDPAVAQTPPRHSIPLVLGNPESVGRRVSQMFQQSKPAMNFQNIFKKK